MLRQRKAGFLTSGAFLSARRSASAWQTRSRVFGRVGLAAASALLFGCQTPVKTELKPGTALANYHTFALMPLQQTSSGADTNLVARLSQSAQETTVQALTAKGYRQTDRAQADFVVNLRGESLPKVEVTDWGYNRTTWTRRYGYVPVHVGEVEVNQYEERTLTIEIFDSKSHELIWTGSMKRKASGEITAEKLKEAINTVLAKFPSAANAK